MNTFLIGSRVEIHHYPDWSGTAFLAFEDAEYRIPGEVARILAESLLSAERAGKPLEQRRLACAICSQPAGMVWVTGDETIEHALCESCHAEIARARDLKADATIPAAIKAAFSPEDKS